MARNEPGHENSSDVEDRVEVTNDPFDGSITTGGGFVTIFGATTDEDELVEIHHKALDGEYTTTVTKDQLETVQPAPRSLRKGRHLPKKRAFATTIVTDAAPGSIGKDALRAAIEAAYQARDAAWVAASRFEVNRQVADVRRRAPQRSVKGKRPVEDPSLNKWQDEMHALLDAAGELPSGV